ncbi:hypothetical protein N8865_00525 [Francisellaceae bacterium]|nr:hypothetical protein [Francisellaceae bacterium]
MYPWLQKTYTKLLESYQNDHFPQSLLICADEGAGISALTRPLARLLLCLNTEASPCGVCKSCERFKQEEAGHPDLTFITLKEEKKIKLEIVQNLIKNLTQTSYLGGARVIVIEAVDRMNISAANAFLKTLEEPNQGVYFILSSATPHKIMPTLLSRVQKISLDLDFQDVEAWLTHKFPQEAVEKIQTVWKLTNGSPQATVQMLEAPDNLELRNYLIDVLCQAERINPVEFAEASLAQGELAAIIYWLILIYSDIYKLELNLDSHCLVNQDKLSILEQLGGKQNADFVYQIYRKLLEMKSLCERSDNLNQQLMLESFYIKLMDIK